jgi:Protein of unknown function (DUF1566)
MKIKFYGIKMNLKKSNIVLFIACFFAIILLSFGCNLPGDQSTVIIGMEYQGGIIAYILKSGNHGYVLGETHGLIAATADQSTGIAWITGGLTQTSFNGGTSTEIGSGKYNTTAMMLQTLYDGGAAKVCDDYVNADTGTGVYYDWYLPSQDELNELYVNKVEVGGYAPEIYWSSSEDLFDGDNALFQYFDDGTQTFTSKSISHRVRAVRAF